MTSDAHQVCYFNETRRSIKRLIKVVFSISIWSAVGLAGQVGSPFEGDLLSRGIASRRAAVDGCLRCIRPLLGLLGFRHWRAVPPARRTPPRLSTMVTFTLILWSHVVHFDAIFSVNVDAK